MGSRWRKVEFVGGCLSPVISQMIGPSFIANALWFIGFIVLTDVIVKTSLGLMGFSDPDDGKWSGNRFVFHEPKHVETFFIKSEKENHHFDFKIVDAKPNSIVHTEIKIDNKRVKAIMRPCYNYIAVDEFRLLKQIADDPANNPICSPRINDKKMARLFVYIKPETDPTIIKIYLTSWEI